MRINELKRMNKTEFAMFIATSKVKELKLRFKNEGLKVSELRKTEVLQKLMELLGEEEERDVDTIDTIIEKVETLKKDIEIRTAQEEKYEGLIVGMLKNEYITLEEFKMLTKHYNLDLMYADKLEPTLDYYSWSSDYYSEVDSYKTGYLNIDGFKFSELGKCYNPNDNSVVDCCKSSFIKDGNIAIAILNDDYDQRLCFFKDKELIANFCMGNSLRIDDFFYYNDVKVLEEYLNIKLIDIYTKLQKKMIKYYEREDFREECRKEAKKKYDQKKKTWESIYGSYISIKFEDIYTEYCNYKEGGKEKEEQAEKAREAYWSNQKSYDYSDYNNLFSNKTTIKNEDKPLYKNIYKTLMLKYHPDKAGDEGTKYAQIINDLKKYWGI